MFSTIPECFLISWSINMFICVSQKEPITRNIFNASPIFLIYFWYFYSTCSYALHTNLIKHPIQLVEEHSKEGTFKECLLLEFFWVVLHTSRPSPTLTHGLQASILHVHHTDLCFSNNYSTYLTLSLSLSCKHTHTFLAKSHITTDTYMHTHIHTHKYFYENVTV